MSDLEQPMIVRPKRKKVWVDYFVNFRWIIVIFVVLPLSFTFYFLTYLGDVWSESKSFKRRQKEHDQNVEKVIKRLKERNPSKDGLVCTARKPYIAVGMRNVDYKRARHFEVDLSDFRNILEIDKERMIARVEPLVNMGQITRVTVPMNLSLAVVAELDKFSLNLQPCRDTSQTKFKFNFSCTTSSNYNSTFNFDAIIDYGPSLSKGQKLMELDEGPDSNYLFKQSFARVFDIAALRVPAEECHALQTRLKGHLLNWPRIKNIARVSGDDIDEHFKELFAENEDQNGINSRNETTDDPLLQRVELANKFNSRGFVHFKKLAHMSRPKVKRRAERGSGRRGNGRRNDDEYAVVEVVEESGETGEDEDLTGLLGDDFTVKSWKGPTRLLLLDERHARKAVSELPQAVQVVLRDDANRSRKIKRELVQCRLTLFYDYWQMDEVLEELLPKGMVVPSSYEVVGHIAHLNLRTEHLPYRRLIAQVVFDKNRPKIQTVVNKTDAIQNEYRTMQLEVLAGNHSLVTTVVENGIRFQVDLATVYWNSRLGTERQRLVNSFQRGDNVCDVFSGVGPLAIAAAKKVNRVYANDLNPFAVKYQMKNIACNKLRGKVEVFNMDGREFIKEILGRENPVFVTQVVMNLPNDAAEYLDAFRGVFREEHRDMHLPLPTIHVYGFSKAPKPESEFLERLGSALGEVPSDVDMHHVRLVAPGKWMLCATFSLPKRVAFAS